MPDDLADFKRKLMQAGLGPRYGVSGEKAPSSEPAGGAPAAAFVPFRVPNATAPGAPRVAPSPQPPSQQQPAAEPPHNQMVMPPQGPGTVLPNGRVSPFTPQQLAEFQAQMQRAKDLELVRQYHPDMTFDPATGKPL